MSFFDTILTSFSEKNKTICLFRKLKEIQILDQDQKLRFRNTKKKVYKLLKNMARFSKKKDKNVFISLTKRDTNFGVGWKVAPSRGEQDGI